MGQHELDMTELDAIVALSGIDWEADDPVAITVYQYMERTGLTDIASKSRLMKLVQSGVLRTFNVRRKTGNGSMRTVRVWKRVEGR